MYNFFGVSPLRIAKNIRCRESSVAARRVERLSGRRRWGLERVRARLAPRRHTQPALAAALCVRRSAPSSQFPISAQSVGSRELALRRISPRETLPTATCRCELFVAVGILFRRGRWQVRRTHAQIGRTRSWTWWGWRCCVGWRFALESPTRTSTSTSVSRRSRNWWVSYMSMGVVFYSFKPLLNEDLDK